MAPSTCSRTPNIVFFWNTDIWFLNLLALKILGGWFLSHSFQNSQVPDTTCVHKLILWNIYTYTNVFANHWFEKFRLPTVRFSVSCRPNKCTLGYNLRVPLISCSRYFMSWRSRNVASRVESPNICFNSATAFSCTHNSEHQQYQWWTCNTAVLCWWAHQLGAKWQCNGCGYKLTFVL